MNTKGSLDRGSRYNGHVEAILKIYLANVKNTGEIVSKYVKEEMALVLNGKRRCQNMLFAPEETC